MEASPAFFTCFWREFQQLANKPGSNLLPSAVIWKMMLGKQFCVALASDGDWFLTPRDGEDWAGREVHLHNPKWRTSSFYSCDMFANPVTMAGPALGKLLFLHCYPRDWGKIGKDRRGTEGLMRLLLTESFPWLKNRVLNNVWVWW